MPLSPSEDCDIRVGNGNPVLRPSQIGATAPINEWPPERITKVLLNWLRYHFSDPARIEMDALRSRVWKNSDDTEIVIASLAEWKPQNSNMRPAVLVNREDQAPAGPRGFDNRLIGGCGIEAVATRYMMIWRGRHVCYCWGGREGEGEMLAIEVARELMQYQSLIREKLCIYRFEIAGVGRRVQHQEHKETYLVPVYIDYGYGMQWRTAPLDTALVTQIIGTTTLT